MPKQPPIPRAKRFAAWLLAGALTPAAAFAPAPQTAARTAQDTGPSAASAQEPAAGEPVQEIDVTGVRPGPNLWRVSRGDHVLWLLGTLDPLPKRMVWRSREVEQVIAQAQEVLPSSPDVSASIGPISLIRLYLQYRRTQRIPEKGDLRESLPPALYARFSALKLRYDRHDRKIEEMRPMFAALRLYERAIDASDLTSRNDIEREVVRLARKHHVSIHRTAVHLSDPRGVLTEVGEIPPAAQIACLEATLERLEDDLGPMQVRARAWALGDVDTLRRLPYPKQRAICTTTVASSPRIKVLMARAASDWEAALEDALAKNRTTLATKPMYDLIGAGGTLATLRAKGYAVEGP